MCIVLLLYAHFQCPVENPAFPRSDYELAHGALIGGVYWASDRENKEKINASSQSSFMARGKYP